MADQQTFVIVGASLAGAKAAPTLREEGFSGRVASWARNRYLTTGGWWPA